MTNRKRPERAGEIQLVDARESFVKMRKSLGDKRNEISPEQIAEITRLYGDFEEGERVKILPTSRSATSASRSNARYACGMRLPRTRCRRSRRPLAGRADRARTPRSGASRSSAWPVSHRRPTATARKLGSLPKAIDKAVWEAIYVRDPEAP